MKIELTIKTDYLPTWGAWEGIRELVQNGRDAEVEFNAPMAVSHLGTTLRIENEGAVLPHEALLLGYTSKSERSDMIGKFGEGLKLGILALVRAGRSVRIRSGSEVWVPTIARSDKFKADVLVFDIQGGREAKSRVRIEIGGVTSSEWTQLKSRFLFLDKPKKNERVETSCGSLLLGDDQKGKVYVRGIFVQNNTKLGYGYNFSSAGVDRDRKMVESFDMEYYSRQVWQQAVAQRPDLFEEFYGMVEEGAEDVRGISQHSAAYMGAELLDKAVEAFQGRYGADAIPVANLAESADIEHLGKQGIVVKPQLQALLAAKLGTIEDVKRKLADEAVEFYSWNLLKLDEQKAFCDARDLMLAAGVENADLLHKGFNVVDFRSATLQGQYSNGNILLARRCLADRDLTLEVLVHEVAHSCGADGDKGHVAAIEHAWSRIVAHLRK